MKAVLGDFDYDTCKNNYLAPFRDLRKHCVISSGDNSTGKSKTRRIFKTELNVQYLNSIRSINVKNSFI